MDSKQIIVQLVHILDQANFDGVNTQHMNEILGVRKVAQTFVAADKETPPDGDNLPPDTE